MDGSDRFWRLDHLSDAQLLASLSGVLRSQRRALAELVAHLAEVEERRLHLEAACSSMFSYCVARLGMSEDEACRRIELARLARRFPMLFVELASGRITLSVALLLKPVLSPGNQRELLVAARGQCIRQARELVAQRFPRPDAPSCIRKLPEQPSGRVLAPAQTRLPDSPSALPPSPTATAAVPTTLVPSAAKLGVAGSLASGAPHAALPEPRQSQGAWSESSPAVPVLALVPPLAPVSPTMSCSPTSPSGPVSSPAVLDQQPRSSLPGDGSFASSSCIEPLSERRYRVQFTADLELKRKLETARDLLRHAHPGGDFAPIVSRALDLLLDDLMRRRFGAKARRKQPSPGSTEPALVPAAAQAVGAGSGTSARAGAEQPSASGPAGSPAESALSPARLPSSQQVPTAALPPGTLPATAPPAAAPPAVALPVGTSERRPHVSLAARRAVLERDGIGCSWVDDHGVRCGSRAWLEIDHRQPVGKDGGSEPENLRLLCRSHNRLAAERAYGRQHMERASTRRRAKCSLGPSP